MIRLLLIDYRLECPRLQRFGRYVSLKYVEACFADKSVAIVYYVSGVLVKRIEAGVLCTSVELSLFIMVFSFSINNRKQSLQNLCDGVTLPTFFRE